MLLTQLATSLAVSLFLLLSWCPGAIAASRLAKMLDLTHIPPSERRSMGAPGGYAGGLSDGTGLGMLSSRYELPVDLRIKTLRPLPDSDRALLVLDVTNTGTARVDIPSCINPFTAFVPNARNRRLMNFGLIYEDPQTGEHSSAVVEVTSGSASVLKCMTPLAAGETLEIMMNVEPSVWRSNPQTSVQRQISVSAFIEESRLKDSGFVIENKSNRVESKAVVYVSTGK